MSIKQRYEEARHQLLLWWAQLRNPKTDEINDPEHDDRYYARMGWLIVIIGFGGFVLWATFAPIDRGVAANGTVITDGQRKVIQPVENGVIDQILVKNGDNVQSGQILVTLNKLDAEAQLNGGLENAVAYQAKIDALDGSINNRKQEIAYLKEQISGMRTLVKEGYVAKNRLLELERTLVQTQGMLQRDEGDLEATRRQLADLNGKIPAYQFALNNTDIKSPVEGSIVNLDVFTKGQVVQAGQKIMEVVPKDQPMVIDAEVPVQLIDRVYTGLKAKVLFTSFNQRTTPKVDAVVTVVPRDRTESKQQPGQYYYLVRLELPPKSIALLQDHEIRAGLPVQVFIITGERSMMNYLFKPLLDRAETSMGEE